VQLHDGFAHTHPDQIGEQMTLVPREHLVVPNGDAEHHRITQVEGIELSGPVDVRVLSEGDDMILLEVTMPPGQASRPHTHDHESVGYLVSGRAQTVVDGVTYDLAPGDGFRHPPHVVHNMQALDEGAVWLEIKSPPTRTW
jgi:quercetin dioxygenase-like cupin family protein